MTIANKRRLSNLPRRLFAFPTLLASITVCVLVGIAYVLFRTEIDVYGQQSATRNTGSNDELQSQFRNQDIRDDEIVITAIEESGDSEFSAANAANNIECKLSRGQKEARNLGVISVPSEHGLEFAVLDQTGKRLSDELPFRANKIRVGTTEEGSILAGFAELRLNSRIFKDRDVPQPIRIYQNKHVIFESDRVWDFDVAPDGASFVVHEPAPSGASRLIVRNLDAGKETHHDLGNRFTPQSAYEKPYALKYSSNNEEVMFEPAYADSMGRGTHWFFPLDQGKPHRITVKDGRAAVFSNSSSLYFVDYTSTVPGENQGRTWNVSRRELSPAHKAEKLLWERNIDLDYFYGTLILSPNGRWLGLSAWNYTVLSTDTGETKLKFSSVGDNESQLKRLQHVLPINASFKDIGELVGSSFIGDHLVFDRKIGSLKACTAGFGGAYNHKTYMRCIRDLRLEGSYRAFQDVFDMNRVTIDSGPIFRYEVFRDSPCAEVDTRLHGLRIDDGEMRYGFPM